MEMESCVRTPGKEGRAKAQKVALAKREFR